MPMEHERTFRVRHYECDAYGHVNHANYLRYMQEAALDASAAAGFGMARYNELGTLWFIRETEISYKRPLEYGSSVVVKTWVQDFRRVQSRRAYEFRHAETGDIIAQAHSDWVYLDAQTIRPTPITDDLKWAFFPEGPPTKPINRVPFPNVPAPPPDQFVVRRHVEWRDIDGAGHVNNAMYMVYLEDCVVQTAAHYGWPMSRMFEAGFGIIARHYRIEYKQSAVLGDELELRTWVTDISYANAERYYTITRVSDGIELVRAHVTWVWVDINTGRPIRIPPYFIADFAANLGEGVSLPT